jgi:stearoyl-CoA desaturase (Delta-9 desaturase)
MQLARPRIRLVDNLVFLGFHVATAVMVAIAGWSWSAVALSAAIYFVFMFGITAGYHRYFAHRSYKTSRAFQFILALIGTFTLQKGVLWWAAHHRRHHRESDQEGDVHSPVQRGFYWAHMGWIMAEDYMETDWDGIKDMARYPELRWLNQHFILPCVVGCALVLAVFDFQHMVWGCFVSVVCLWHMTFCINSLAHVWGRQVYATSDQSRNNALLAVMTLGEGWHNNHHFFMTSARQGFRWYELDVSYIVLCILEKLGIVWDLKRPSPEIVDGWLGGKDHLLSRAPAREALVPVGAGSAPIAAAAAVAAIAAMVPAPAPAPLASETPPAASAEQG